MKLNKLILSAVMIFVGIPCGYAQNPAILSRLKSKYSLTRYQPQCGGWYLIGYSERGVNYYGFADREGNVIATNAVKYKIHPGFVEMQIFDELKKDEHDMWLQDKKQYDRDMVGWERENKKYEAEVEAYNQRMAQAKKEAQAQYQAARQAAYDNAVELYRLKNSGKSTKSSSLAGSIISGLAQGIGEASAGNAAANKVSYQTYETAIIGAWGLSVKPMKPYNPKPEMPAEPSNGYEWKYFPLLQPCPYTEVDYEAISDDKGVAIVKSESGYGLCNASLKSVLPCKYSAISKAGKNFRVKQDEKIGLVSPAGKFIAPCEFANMKYEKGVFLCKKNNLWGVYSEDFEELYPCQYNNISLETVDGKNFLYAQYKGLWGAFNFDNGQQVLPFSFGKIETGKFGRDVCFEVKRDKYKGLFTTSGLMILPCEFETINQIKIGDMSCLSVTKDGKTGLYDRDLFPILEPGKYDKYEYVEDRGFIVSNNAKKGWYDLAGNELIPIGFSEISIDRSNPSLFQCKKNGNCALVDCYGKEIFPAQPVEMMYTVYTADKSGKTVNYVVVKTNDGKFSALDYNGNVIASGAKEPHKLSGKVFNYFKDDANSGAFTNAKNQYEEAERRALEKYAATVAKRNTYSHYAQNYVERIVNDWQKKGEYEKAEDWKKRVNEDTRQQKVFTLSREAQEQYVKSKKRILPSDKISIVGNYDPDNETFQIRSLYSDKPLIVNIDAGDAEVFKTHFDQVHKFPKFTVQNDFLGLVEYKFVLPNGNSYTYKHQDALKYSVADVEYKFNKIDVASVTGNGEGKTGLKSSQMGFGKSDVDVNIPISSQKQENTFAIIIANENYENEKNVDFAFNDGVILKEYCVKTLGLPETNVHFVPNATLNQIRQQINWIKKTSADFKGEAKFIVYYAGHGMPDDDTKDAYLIPTDADSSDLESCYKLSQLYANLSEIEAKDVLVLMDACFSGSQRNGETLASARGVALRPKINQPYGALTVFSAVSDKETAYAYNEKNHGLFTYFLLKKLREHSGNLNLGELAEYVSDNVAKHSIVVNKKSQHPTVNTAAARGLEWRSIKIR